MSHPKRRATLEAALKAPWAILPSTLSQIVDWSRRASSVQHVDVPILGAMDGPHDGATRVGIVSVIPIYGVIENHSDWWLELFGGTSVESIREALMAELNDPGVRAIVLDIDSPGGTVAGITEFAAELRAARGGAKPIVTVYNTLGASAAYWLGSQADEVVVTPSGQVGSIGVYAIHQEVSRMLDAMGITTNIISAGPYKTEGNEFEPLTDEARTDIQGRVDASYAQFLSDVAAGRRITAADVAANYGEGRVLVAKEALAAGMVDRIGTLAQTVARLNRAAGAAGPGRRAASPFLDLAASAIASHKTETDDGPWDGDAMEKNCPAEEAPLRASHAWVDETGDPNLKGSYKFIHHLVAEDGSVGAANMTACSSGIGYLNRAPGANGRPDIPDADRKGVHAHLASHMVDGGMQAPDMMGLPPFTERVVALAIEAEELVEHARERARLRAKEGRPAFSTSTERSLRAIREAVDELLEPDDPVPSKDPAEPDEPVPAEPSMPPVATAIPMRFRSDEEWLAYLQENR